jgi:hypothetical protein
VEGSPAKTLHNINTGSKDISIIFSRNFFDLSPIAHTLTSFLYNNIIRPSINAKRINRLKIVNRYPAVNPVL